MTDKEKNILDKAEDVILEKIKHYEQCVQDMDKDDCYALQILVMTEGRIQSIRNGITREMSY